MEQNIVKIKNNVWNFYIYYSTIRKSRMKVSTIVIEFILFFIKWEKI